MDDWVVEIYENQRWSSVIGWSSDELQSFLGDPSPWSWPNGQSQSLPSPSPPLVFGWKYDDKSKWEIDLNVVGVDENGWIYANSFQSLGAGTVLTIPHKDANIRRRVYIRPVVQKPIKSSQRQSVSNSLHISNGKRACCNQCGFILEMQ